MAVLMEPEIERLRRRNAELDAGSDRILDKLYEKRCEADRLKLEVEHLKSEVERARFERDANAATIRTLKGRVIDLEQQVRGQTER